MKKIIQKIKSFTFQEKAIYSTRLSVITNTIFAIAKIILSFFQGVFFLVAGIFNIFVAISKLHCYIGARYGSEEKFAFHNRMIGIFLFLAGLQYGIYMARLIFTDIAVMEYDMFLGIAVATISFVELGFAIKGMFNAYGKGHYFRNIKLINFCSSLTAIVTTEIALTSFASEVDTRFMNGLFGIIIAFIIILISIYVLIAPKISIVDREHNVYVLKEGKEKLKEETLVMQLTFSKLIGNYSYVAKVEDDIIDGRIIKGKSPIAKWNIWIKILVIVLSEILIFVYAGWALVFHFRCANLIKKLDKIMLEKGYIKDEFLSMRED